MLHGLAGAGKDHHEEVHHEAGVDPRAQDGDAVGLGQGVDLFGQLGLLGLGISHFFGAGDHVDLPLHRELNLIEGALHEGIGAKEHHVGGAGLDDVFRGADDHVGTAPPGHVEELVHALAELGSSAHHSHDLKALLFEHHLRHALAHGAETPNDHLHVFLAHRVRPPP